jgi:hypothetical protein
MYIRNLTCFPLNSGIAQLCAYSIIPQARVHMLVIVELLVCVSLPYVAHYPIQVGHCDTVVLRAERFISSTDHALHYL